MPSLEILKLSSDGLLVVAIMLLCYRILISGSISTRSAKLVMLEASLRSLIKDAEGAGRSLNDELSRRQHSLERLLSDLTTAEGRLSLTQESIKATQASIEARSQAEIRSAPEARAALKNVLAVIETVDEIPEAPTFASVRTVANQAANSAARSLRQTATDVRALARQIEVSREHDDQRIETVDEVAKEAPKPSAGTNDNRLGVLGGIKRQVQTL